MKSFFGLVVDIDGKNGYVRVKDPETKRVTEFIPVLRPFAQDNSVSIPVTINEQVLVGSTDNEREYVIGAVPSDVDKPYTGASENRYGVKFSDGSLFQFDIEDQKLSIHTPNGLVEIEADEVTIKGATSVSIESAVSVEVKATNIKLTGIVTVDGVLIASSGITATGGISVDGQSFATHKHTGVTTGSGISGPVLPLP